MAGIIDEMLMLAFSINNKVVVPLVARGDDDMVHRKDTGVARQKRKARKKKNK